MNQKSRTFLGRGAGIGVVLVLALGGASAQDSVSVKSTDGASDVQRLVVSQSNGGQHATVRVENALLRLSSTLPLGTVAGGDIRYNSGNVLYYDGSLWRTLLHDAGSGANLTNLNAANITSGTLVVARGGTGTGSFTTNGLLLGNGTSAVSALSVGGNGSVLRGTGGAPTWGNSISGSLATQWDVTTSGTTAIKGTSTSSGGYGLYGVSSSGTGGQGVFGKAGQSGTSGLFYGVYGEALAATGDDQVTIYNNGVFGNCTTTGSGASMVNAGVRGECTTNSTGLNYGVYGTVSGGGGGTAIRGLNTAATGTLEYGVSGECTGSAVGSTKYGLYGNASGTAADNYGVYGTASGGTNNYAVYGTGTGSNYAGYFNGNLSATDLRIGNGIPSYPLHAAKTLAYAATEKNLGYFAVTLSGNQSGNQPVNSLRIAEPTRIYGQTGKSFYASGALQNGSNNYSYAVSTGDIAPWSSAGWMTGVGSAITLTSTGSNEDHIFGINSDITAGATVSLAQANDEVYAFRGRLTGTINNTSGKPLASLLAENAVTNSSGTVTRYGVHSTVSGNGATSTNVAGYFNATGATNNYGLVVAGGNTGIGTTTPGNILTVQQNSATDPIADSWTTYSSRRFKENIRPIEGALEKVQKLEGVRFDWKEGKKNDVGFIAEEVGKVVPEVVEYEDNGTDARGLDYARIVPILVESIKLQQKQIETQQTQIDDLKKEVQALREAQ